MNYRFVVCLLLGWAGKAMGQASHHPFIPGMVAGPSVVK